MKTSKKTKAPSLIVDSAMLERFGACEPDLHEFVEDYPDGLDIGGLWGTSDEAEVVWLAILGSRWRSRVGWAIGVGLVPARIRANLCRADLRNASLFGAGLRYANLLGADLCLADLCLADLHGANLLGADLCLADLRGANLCGANLCNADLRWAKYDARTIWPRDFVLPESAVCMD